MRILVTGGAGFIGYHTTLGLSSKGYDVVCYDNVNDYYDVSLKYGRLNELGIEVAAGSLGEQVSSCRFPNLRFVKGDFADPSSLHSLFKDEKFDMILHLGAQAGVRYSLTNPQEYITSNITGFFNILDAAVRFNVPNIVYASSSSVYGLNEETIFTETDDVQRPASLYGATKKSNELMAHAYSHTHGLNTVGLRFFTVYGPWGRPDMAIYKFTKSILKGEPIKVFNNGQMKRDFTYVDDVVGAVCGLCSDFDRIIEKERVPYKVYNLGNGSPVELMRCVEVLEERLGINAEKEFLPIQVGDVVSTYSDSSEIFEDLGIEFNTSIEVGIDKFVSWYLSYHNIGI